MKNIYIFIIFSTLTLSGLSSYLFYFKPLSESQYKAGNCFKDLRLQVIFQVEKVKVSTYLLTVVHSGHYNQSPEFAEGTKLEYLRSYVDNQPQYHPSLCEVIKPPTE